jgi:hypothetical protein
MINKIILVLIHPNIKANLIQKIYTGFNILGEIKANIKDADEIKAVYIIPCLRLIKINKVIKKKAVAIIRPNFFRVFICGFNFSISLIRFKNFLV